MLTACQPATRVFLFGILLDSFINRAVPVLTALLKSVDWVFDTLNVPKQEIRRTLSKALCLGSKERRAVANTE